MARSAGSPAPSERASAALALVSLAAALAVLALNLALRIGAFVLALVGLLGCVTACWYVVARRGLVRVLAVGAALIGLAALITGLVLAVISVWIVVAAAALALISVLSARYALRRTPKALRSRAAAAGPPGTARRPAAGEPDGGGPARSSRGGRSERVLIMNLRSGGGKAERYHLADECRARGIEPVVLRQGDDLAGLAEAAVARGARTIGMAGGDGSQAIVAAVAAEAGVAHVCVPAGTRNHFALDLGLDRDDVTGALEAYSEQIERRVDLAYVNGHPFVNNCSLGLYARIVQSPQYRHAKLKTAADMLPDLIGPDAEPLDLRFAGPAGESLRTAHLILISNDPYQLARPGGRGTRERLDLGLLGIVAVQVADAAEARRFMLLELGGQVQRFGGWQEWTGTTFAVDSGGPVEVGVDGEAMVLEPPLRFESRPGALRVWLPERAVRVSPAGRAVHLLSRSTAADLASVAAGSRPAR